ncbi:hypothetical protein StDouc24_00930 [Streptococcus thermophilus]|uniref:hypothetical protein n=1 Tax=Streptococcus TaxID=1301 RepID=UPI0006408A67|nr:MULTISPECIES: hypothetical protein [Streptococcus]MEE3698262.1 hypothetical protein [Streptococcus uberis]HEL0231609.1 hypothetical protein [Streptococcus equi subsp. zooepidemicus]KLL92901.1 hypothetical protein VZ98_00400 [Streptococcus agalactiae]MBW7797189.1 hypothetical protein [Streptococcus thermophilus]MCD0088445.1 hypothetical protein [Streptococcus agalactiae]
MDNIKIVRGYYLTGLGQEPLAYYFKITEDFPEFRTIKAGDVALTFYQNGEAITSIPALIRVDGVIEVEKQVLEFLKSEKKDHFPMLPLVGVYEHFDPLRFNTMMTVFEGLKAEIKRLAKVDYVQGDLFEFIQGGEG